MIPGSLVVAKKDIGLVLDFRHLVIRKSLPENEEPEDLEVRPLMFAYHPDSH